MVAHLKAAVSPPFILISIIMTRGSGRQLPLPPKFLVVRKVWIHYSEGAP